MDQDESQTLCEWFTHRTGRPATLGPAFEQDQGLMVSMMFELRVQWAIWTAARPALADLLGVDPLDDACTALTAGHPRWVRLWHALASAYPDEPRALVTGADWVSNPRHFATPYWSILWETLLDSDWRAFPDARERPAGLIALGRV